MSRFVQLILALAILAAPTIASSGTYYDPDQPGHGVTVIDVGDRYTAQWFFHDGDQARWLASDVCDWGTPCSVWTVDADGFPAVGAGLIDAGSIILERDGSFLKVDYDLDIEEVLCGLLPGPLPPECRAPGGEPASGNVLVPGFGKSGTVVLRLLAE